MPPNKNTAQTGFKKSDKVITILIWMGVVLTALGCFFKVISDYSYNTLVDVLAFLILAPLLFKKIFRSETRSVNKEITDGLKLIGIYLLVIFILLIITYYFMWYNDIK